MDLTLNICNEPVPKKKKNTKVENKKIANLTNSDNSFEFKWDSPKKVKATFVKKNVQKVNKTPQLFNKKSTETKTTAIITADKNKTFNKDLNKETSPRSSFEKPLTSKNNTHPEDKIIQNNNAHKKKQFPLFEKFSKSAPVKKYENVKGKPIIEKIFSNEGKTFKDLNIHPHIVTNLERMGLVKLTAVQEQACPEIFKGKNVFVRSQTGSGKTLTYAIPIVEKLRSIEPHIDRKDGVRAVVVLPTRELALQTYEHFMKLVEPFRWIVPGKLCGGENRNSEKARIRKGITILIGTPGRLLDHAQHTQNLRLDKVKYVVLDEADRLLDIDLHKDVNKLIEIINGSNYDEYDPLLLLKSAHNPGASIEPPIKNNTNDRQTILLSATLTSNVKDLANFTMKEYVYIDPLNTDPNIDLNVMQDQLSTIDAVIPESVQQEFVVTDVRTRLVVLCAYIISKNREKNCKMFVFMASKQMVEYHELLFKKCLLKRPKNERNPNNVISMEDSDDSDSEDELIDDEDCLELDIFKLHGSMEQKERTEIFKAFRAATKGVLLCTDVATRGVDIPHADFVVQYTGPLKTEDYIHKVGRTGRAGQKGSALLFLTEPEIDYIKHLNDKHFYLKRKYQDDLLKYLVPYMEHVSPNSAQVAAEILQKRFEKALVTDKSLFKAACLAYSSWTRFYSSFPGEYKKFFNIKKAHLGHYVTSFGLKESPQEISRIIKKEVGKTEKKNLNKKLDNYEQEPKKIVKQLKPKKRPRSEELLLSEFDSGLKPTKKKKFK